MKKLIMLLILMISIITVNAQVVDHIFEPIIAKADTSALNAHIKHMNIKVCYVVKDSGLIIFGTDNKLSAIEFILLCNRYVKVPDEYRFKIYIGKDVYQLSERELHKWCKI